MIKNESLNLNGELVEVAAVKEAAMIYRAVNHRLRQKMMQLIHKHGRLTVTDLFMKLDLEQSVTSQHLSILRKAGLVKTERENRFIYYSVNYPRLEQLHSKAKELIGG